MKPDLLVSPEQVLILVQQAHLSHQCGGKAGIRHRDRFCSTSGHSPQGLF